MTQMKGFIMTATDQTAPEFKDCRRHERISVSKTGRLIAPFSDGKCTFHDVSASGAKLKADRLLQLGDEVAVDLPRVGYARGTVVRLDADTISVEFEDNDTSRNRIADRLERLGE